MTIDFWGLGLQTINIVILVWLLSLVFWRPVADAIARRQQTTETMLDEAKEDQARANRTLSEVTEIRAGITAEREAMLARTTTEAQDAARSSREEAKREAAKLIDAAKQTIARDNELAAKSHAANAATLSLEIASKLLNRLDKPVIHAAFLTLLIDAIEQMPAQDRKALTGTDINLVSARELTSGEKTRVTKAIHDALQDTLNLRFIIDPDLVAGLEIRTPHFVLHNSWQADIKQILKAMTDAG
jgi:F-type H+-transporting ATPase subunit b